MKNKLLAVLLLVLSVFLGGCEYSHEITEMAFAVALGLDVGKEGLRVSVQFAQPLNIAGEGGGEEESSGAASGSEESGEAPADKNQNTTMLTVEAEDIYTALSVAESSLSKRVNLSHVKLLLFSADLAKEGIRDYVTLFMKNSRFSPNTYTAVSLCRAEDYMREVSPALEQNPAKYYTLLFSQSNGDFMPATTLRELYFHLSAQGREPVLPAAGIDREETKPLKNGAAQGDYEAGELSKGSENRTDVSGMAVFRDGKLSQILSSHDAMAYQIFIGELRESYLSLPSPTQEGKRIVLRITQAKKPKKKVRLEENGVYIEALVPLSAEIAECPKHDLQQFGFSGLGESASAEMSARLKSFCNVTAKECRADVVGFGELAKRQFSDFPAWQAYDWQTKYPNAEFSIVVSVNVTSEGLVQERSKTK